MLRFHHRISRDIDFIAAAPVRRDHSTGLFDFEGTSVPADSTAEILG
jgi:hypothetical protein